MSLELYMHPLSSYCWKALTALYENETPFEPRIVDLGNPEERAAFLRLTPRGKFPALRDTKADKLVVESSIIIEYLALNYPGRTELLPKDSSEALEVRAQDRFFDLYVHQPMQQIIGDRIRPADKRDPYGVQMFQEQLRSAYGILERSIVGKTWATGDRFTMADCAAAPALHYANRVVPFGAEHPNVAAYLGRLEQRPSFARAMAEAKPYAQMFPG